MYAYVNYAEYSCGYYKINNKLCTDLNMNLKYLNNEYKKGCADTYCTISIDIDKILSEMNLNFLDEVLILDDKYVCDFIFEHGEIVDYGFSDKEEEPISKESLLREIESYIKFLFLVNDKPIFLEYLNENLPLLSEYFFETEKSIIVSTFKIME